jgi:hypothetical protein
VTLPADNSENLTIDCGYVCIGEIGDFVWHDVNHNGCQDAGEPGIPGVQVDLYAGCAPNQLTLIRSTNTDANGLYHFNALCAGTYTVAFHTPAGYTNTLANQACNVGGQPADATDSDCNCLPGAGPCGVCVTLPTATGGNQDLTIDCGYIPLTPDIEVTKEVACYLPGNTCGTYAKVATGVRDGECPAFCYRITVRNAGGVTITTLSVTDTLLGNISSMFASALPLVPGESVTVEIKGVTLCQDTNNVVTANGGTDQGLEDVDSDAADAVVLNINIECNLTVSPTTLPAGTVDAPITVNLTLRNTGSSPLTVTNISGLPALVDCTDLVTPVEPVLPFDLDAGESATFTACTLVSCPGAQYSVRAHAVASDEGGTLCVYDSSGNRVSDDSEPCPATVTCEELCVCVDPGFGLGAAGSSTVLQLDAHKVDITGPPGGLIGNVSIGPGGKLSMSGDEFVTGTIRLGVGAQFKNSSHFAVTVEHNVDLSQAINDAYTAYTNALALPCSQSFEKLDGKSVTNITGSAGMNVICVGDVSLSGKQVYLTGPAGTKFIVRVTGKFSLTGGGAGPQIRTAGDVKPSDVLYVMVDTGAQVAFSGGGGGQNCCAAIVDGTLLAPYRKIALAPGLVNGQIISGMDISIVSGSSVRCPCP